MKKSGKRTSGRDQRGIILRDVRHWTRIMFQFSGGKPLNLDTDIIPTLRGYMGKHYRKGVNRAYLLNSLMTKGKGFAVRFDGESVLIINARARKKMRPRAVVVPLAKTA